MKTERKCNKDCYKCGKSSFRTDDKGYPFGIECLKYSDSFPLYYSDKEKVFKVGD